jgi:WD40 repeat protein
MPDQEQGYQYDLFLSHASEDKDWCEKLAERLRDQGVRVWFDGWELRPGDNLMARINDGLKSSRKMVAVFSRSYFKDTKVWTRAESYAQQSPDILSRERPLIPALIEDCEIEPTLRGILFLDFRNPDDFDLRLRQLIEAIDLPRREFAREELEFREHELDHLQQIDLRLDPRRRNYAKGNRFEDEIATLYRLLGFETKQDIELSGMQIDLAIQQKTGGMTTQAIVECKDRRITSDERDQILAQQNLAQRKLPRHRWIAVSSQGFAADARVALEEAGVDCVTYAELLRELLPLDNYVDGMIAEHEKFADEKWNGEDWFIRPDLVTDIVYERMSSLAHFSKWLGEERRNQLVILGDLGTGKSTLAGFLAYNLARSFRDDPLRHPAPVLIPLKDVRKEVSLEGIVINHFGQRGIRDISFTRFEHLVRLGKIVLLFDAFDEMADRVRWDVTQSNFRELSRAADLQGKVILTCRTHYFKDRNEQVKVIGEGPRLSEVETELYRELRRRSNAEVVYLQEFDDRQIQDYLKKARPRDHKKDWQKIQAIYNLKDLATRPLLLDMIVKSLPRLKAGLEVNAANLYNVYTNIWIEREEGKGRKFMPDRNVKLALMLELAWRMWRDEKQAVHYRELVPFVEKLVADRKIEIGDEEIADVAGEMQGASFLKRDDAGNFYFMHRSFGEFFVARKINDCLADAARELPDLLNTRRYGQKTIYFLTRLDEQDRMREPLRQILTGGYRPNVSENALQLLYWSARIRAGMEEKIESVEKLQAALAGRIPAGAKLDRANLQEITLECADLTEADLTGADLTKAKLNHATFDRAALRDASLVEASVENASARDSDLRNADLGGATFSRSDMTGSDFSGARNQSREGFVNATLALVNGLSFDAGISFELLRPVVQLGASHGVNAVTVSPDGELIAAGGGDGVIRLYRASDGALLRALEGHSSSVRAVTFTADGAHLVSGSNDRTVRIWQADSGKLLRTFKGHTDWVIAVACAPDGKTLASGGEDQTIRLWQADTGMLLYTLSGHSHVVSAVTFAPDGKTLASGSYDNTICLWQFDSGKLLRTLGAHTHGIRAVAYAPDGKTLASGSEDKTVGLWQTDSGKLLRTLAWHAHGVRAVAFAPDGKTLASGGEDKTICLWETQSGKLLRTLEGHTQGVSAVAFLPDGKTLASGGEDKTVHLWQADSGKLLRAFEGHSLMVSAVTFAPDGRTLASGGYDKTVRLWQPDSGKLLRTLEGHAYGVSAVAFAPDGKAVASGSEDKTIRLWETQSGKTLRTLKGHSHQISAVAFAPDGGTLASGGYDNTIRLWRAGSGKLLRVLKGHSHPIRALAFHPDGKTLASGSEDKTVCIWQADSGMLLDALTWVSDSGKPLHRYEGHSLDVSALDFAPDGKTLASGSYDNTIRLWRTDSGLPWRALKGHSNGVSAVAFAPDGRTLASGGYDNTVRLWQVYSGEPLQYFAGHSGPVYALAFAPNGKYLATSGSAGRLQFWDIQMGVTFLYHYNFGPGAWLSLLPDGRFDASPDGIRYLGYTEEGAFNRYPAEALVKEFYAPDAVRGVLAKYA